MNTIKSLFICAIILIGVAVGCVKEEKHIAINGSATMGPLMKKLAESFKQATGRESEVTEAGSLKGLSLLIADKNDIAVSSVKISSEQLWEAQKKKIAIKEILVGYDIIIPIIHRSNGINNLFLGQLADMYTGLIKDWKEAGGKPGKIIVVDRNDESGTKMVMSEEFFESKTVVEGSVKKKCDSDVVSFVAQHPGAIGYISQSYRNSSIKAVNINGVNAMIENVEKKEYPLCRELYLYVNEKSYTGEIKSFIEFVLSKKGQDILQQQGFIPVARLKMN